MTQKLHLSPFFPHSASPLVDWAGALHIHSEVSDGSGTYSEIAEAAIRAELDFAILTDHGSVKFTRLGGERWHDKTLILTGQETGRRMGHCLVIGSRRPIHDPIGDLKAIVSESERQDAVAILAHPEGSGKLLFGIHDNSWKDRSFSGFLGFEIWSFMYDWIHDLHWFNAPFFYLHPEKFLRGPREKMLKLWDSITQTRPVVGFAGLDAHAVKKLGLTAFPYEFLFKTLRTHVLASPPTGSVSVDRRALLDAMRAGHVYFSNDFHLSAKGFGFEARQGEVNYLQGDSVDAARNLRLFINMPAESDARVILNGEVFDSFSGRSKEIDIEEPGAYRVEVERDGFPWIFSNPIYVRNGA